MTTSRLISISSCSECPHCRWRTWGQVTVFCMVTGVERPLKPAKWTSEIAEWCPLPKAGDEQ